MNAKPGDIQRKGYACGRSQMIVTINVTTNTIAANCQYPSAHMFNVSQEPLAQKHIIASNRSVILPKVIEPSPFLGAFFSVGDVTRTPRLNLWMTGRFFGLPPTNASLCYSITIASRLLTGSKVNVTVLSASRLNVRLSPFTAPSTP